MIKLYVYSVFIIFMAVIVFGILGPMMISSNSTEFVILGVVLIITTVPILFKWSYEVYKMIIDLFFNNKNINIEMEDKNNES